MNNIAAIKAAGKKIKKTKQNKNNKRIRKYARNRYHSHNNKGKAKIQHNK